MEVLFLKKLGALLRRRRFGKELDEEMGFHREQVERAFIAEGMEPKAARYAAMRQFGNATRAKEKSHEVVGFRFESVMQDARYALRQAFHDGIHVEQARQLPGGAVHRRGAASELLLASKGPGRPVAQVVDGQGDDDAEHRPEGGPSEHLISGQQAERWDHDVGEDDAGDNDE